MDKLERKTKEKNRRIHMKNLFFQLLSLIPPQHFNPSKEYLSRQDQLEQVAEYIKNLRSRVEELKSRKNSASAQASFTHDQAANYNYNNDSTNIVHPMSESKLAILRIREMGSNLEVVLINGNNKNIRMHQIISIIEEEGAQVVTASFSNTGDKIFHTLHAQVKVSNVGVDITRISERLHKLIS